MLIFIETSLEYFNSKYMNSGGVTAANFLIITIRYKNTGSCWLCTATQVAKTAQGKPPQTLLRDKITISKTIYGKQNM